MLEDRVYSSLLLPHPSTTMVNFTILAGGYSSFIASYLFNPEAGVLQYTGQSETNANPSWIEVGLTDPNVLFAVNEDLDGKSLVVDASE